MPGTDLKKKREILFAKFPPGQVPEAADDLQRLADLEVQAKHEDRVVGVAYDLQVHTLRELDEHLVDKGYHLDNTLFTKLTRALIYYVEDTQLHNIGAPEKRLKRSSQQAYVHAWEHHPHGDHDETPPEWREYK
ncbi:MAG TPA: hypothetical protein VK165_17975 [Azonexus sp.]|nr:hypothetical protein [Azonexus sp.]